MIGFPPRWATLHPSNWTSVELAGWLEYVAEEYKMDSEVTGSLVDSFQDLDGRRLLQMSQDDFRAISEQHGEFLFEIFKQMCSAENQFAGMTSATLLPPITESSRSATPSPTGSRESTEGDKDLQEKQKDSSNK
ncbi:ETS-related transcription factor Elf-5-like [Saccostrea cucullata]|uniref:ETS-related transcription factor Elf-5-like n=1 Tax=Saccostrea cuccullata TaxID=36930 RepID=UPI002ED30A52